MGPDALYPKKAPEAPPRLAAGTRSKSCRPRRLADYVRTGIPRSRGGLRNPPIHEGIVEHFTKQRSANGFHGQGDVLPGSEDVVGREGHEVEGSSAGSGSPRTTGTTCGLWADDGRSSSTQGGRAWARHGNAPADSGHLNGWRASSGGAYDFLPRLGCSSGRASQARDGVGPRHAVHLIETRTARHSA